MLPERSILGHSLEGISSLKKSIKPPPCVVLLSLHGGVNPSKINFRGNDLDLEGMCRLTLFQILVN